MSDVERKTPVYDANGKLIGYDETRPTGPLRITALLEGTPPAPPATFQRNILHKYRSFNYLFTLSACSPDALNNQEKIIQCSENFVIAKSSGKAINQLKSKSVGAGNTIDDISREFETVNLVESFNSKSPGRFDLFLNNIEVDTLMSFNETTNFSMATKLRFEVIESLSINGFIEALQVSSQAAGNYTYVESPFILKVEFLGYPDTDEGPSTVAKNVGAQATRYLIIQITKVEVELTETGTRYRCQAIAHNEMGFGDHNALKEPIQMIGTTVQEILTNLMQNITAANKSAAIAEAAGRDNEEAKLYDEYEIIFPTPNWNDGTFDYNKPWDKIKNALLVEVSESPAVFAFPSPADVSSAYDPSSAGPNRGSINPTVNPTAPTGPRVPGSTYVYNKNKISVTFPKGAKIHDIIAAVIRDSAFGRNLIKEYQTNSKNIIDNVMIEWFHVAIETEQKHKMSARYNRPIYKYKFVVLPYKMHYSRVPILQREMTKPEQEKLQRLYISKKYEYIYTGKNVDVRRFNLTFNHLYFQAIPRMLGNVSNKPIETEQASPTGAVVMSPVSGAPSQAQINSGNVSRSTPPRQGNQQSGRQQRQRQGRQSGSPPNVSVPHSARHSDPRRASVTGPGGNATIPSKDPYDALLKNMHQAILDNTGMLRCELEILGDPYFLVTGGMGNYRPKIRNGIITENGEAPYQTNDVLVQLEFRNPEDIDPQTGSVIFNSDRAPFGGCFRVTKVVNKFSDGLFTQNLNLIRIPGQSINSTAPENVGPTPRNNTRVSENSTNNSSDSFFESVPTIAYGLPSNNTTA